MNVKKQTEHWGFNVMVPAAIATSIDAFAVGVWIGHFFGNRLGNRAGILGGVILILIGVQIFIMG